MRLSAQSLSLIVLATQLLFASAFAVNNNNNNNNIPTPASDATARNSASSSDITTCDAIMTISKFRSVRKIMPRPNAHWVGDGFKVLPIFANMAFTEEISPLLMFDYAAPNKFPAKVGAPLGVGQHPHRGFETVTIAFQGEVEHHDSTGNSGKIGPGDIQWMTAGRGIIHQEYHSKEFTRTGGNFEMIQLWVNLPKKNKMTKPQYQTILKNEVTEVKLPLGVTDDASVLGTVRIIAGEVKLPLGVTDDASVLGTGPAKTFSPVQLWDINLPHAGAEIDIPFPSDHQCIIFVRRGEVEVLSGESDAKKLKSSALGPQDAALMRMDGSDTLRLRVLKPNSSVMVMGGEPLHEPIAAQGPFVMNTQDEIQMAKSDYRMGKMGR